MSVELKEGSVHYRIDKDQEMKEQRDQEIREWLDSLEYVRQTGGPERVQELLTQLQIYAQKQGVEVPFTANTPYINTIPADRQPPFPGSREIERRIKSITRSACRRGRCR
jgi:pyruvate dehydrogenase E1 component